MDPTVIANRSEFSPDGSDQVAVAVAQRALQQNRATPLPVARNDDAKILVVDDDRSVAELLSVSLSMAGYRVFTSHDGATAIRLAEEHHPDLVLLDVGLPVMDGFEICRRLRSTRGRSAMNIIMLSGRADTGDHVRGFAEGADDYVNKPFDPAELVSRVEAMLKRAHELRSINPLTGMPGNMQIEQEIVRRLSHGERIAVLHADLDSFKAYNDRYGFLRGDDVIRTTACLLGLVAQAWPDTFVGHVGGDDFVIVSTARTARDICALAIDSFDACVADLYDRDDARRGNIVLTGRRGEKVLRRLLSLSIGGATNERRPKMGHRQLIAMAAEMKVVAKRTDGSAFVIERRTPVR